MLVGIKPYLKDQLVFIQCFDTVKIVPDMTYNVLIGTLSLYTTTCAVFQMVTLLTLL